MGFMEGIMYCEFYRTNKQKHGTVFPEVIIFPVVCEGLSIFINCPLRKRKHLSVGGER